MYYVGLQSLDVGESGIVQIHANSYSSRSLNCVLCSWGKRAAHNRAQIVYYIAENLELRRDEVAQRINTMKGTYVHEWIHKID